MRVARAIGLDQCKQFASIVGMEPDAAMGGRAPKMLDGVGAMDCITTIEENRMGHGGVVVFLGEIAAVHAGWFEIANGGAVASAGSGDRPAMPPYAIDGNIHLLA